MTDHSAPVTLSSLIAMKERGEPIVAVVAWDTQTARIADRVGVDILSVGDTVGVNLWGRSNPLDVSLDEMVLVAGAVRRGVRRALVSVDFPFGPLQQGPAAAVEAAIRLAKDAGTDLVKLDGAADHLAAVEAVVAAGIPVFAQMGLTPQTALRHGVDYGTMVSGTTSVPEQMLDAMVGEARALESAGASLLNITNSGPVVGEAVARAVRIPVLGGLGGGPWLDGRVRLAAAAIGSPASLLDATFDTYGSVAEVTFEALAAYASDVRAGRQIRSGTPPAR